MGRGPGRFSGEVVLDLANHPQHRALDFFVASETLVKAFLPVEVSPRMSVDFHLATETFFCST
eukprot:9077733-Pyramimonas_sp.AAC.1